MDDTTVALRTEKTTVPNDSEIFNSGAGSGAGPGVGSGANSGICRPLVRILDQNKSLSRRFFELINRLNKFFSITKAVLVFNDIENDSLKLMTVWEQAHLREGVMLTIPPKDSLLRRAKGIRLILNRAASGDFPPEYQGNFIENNILFDKSTSSLAICPLLAENNLMGVTCLSSPVPFAFELIEKGYFDDIFRQLGEILAEKNRSVI